MIGCWLGLVAHGAGADGIPQRRVPAAISALVAHQAPAQPMIDAITHEWHRGADPSVDWQTRVTANLWVATYLHRPDGRLRTSTDAFLLARLAEHAYQRAWDELRPRVPHFVPVSPDELAGRATWAPAVTTGVADFQARLFGHPVTRRPGRLTFCDAAAALKPYRFASLWVSPREQVEIRHTLLDDARGCMSEDRYRTTMLEVVEQYRALGDFEAAGALLDELTRGAANERYLQLVREERDKVAAEEVGRRRSLPRRLFVNGIPIFTIDAFRRDLWLADADHDTGSALDYAGPRPFTSVVITGGVPRDDVRAGVRLQFTPPEGWAPPRRGEEGWTKPDATPSAGVAFGLVDLETPVLCQGSDMTTARAVPTRGWAVLVRDGGLELVEISEQIALNQYARCGGTSNTQGRLEIADVPLARVALPASDDVALEVRVEGASVVAEAGGATLTHELAERPVGFTGLVTSGAGFVRLSELVWTTP